MGAELAFMSAVELAQNIREKKISSLEATENFFKRIDLLDHQLHSYLTLCQDQALSDARAADEADQKGGELGPLHRRHGRRTAPGPGIGLGRNATGDPAGRYA